MTKKTEKFSFDTEFQEELLRFTVTDKKEGFKALLLYRDNYFTLTEHAVIAKALKAFYKRKKKVPSRPMLKEELRGIYNHKDYINLLLSDDKKRIKDIVDNLYERNAKDGDSILEECIKFSRYVELKDVMETVDIQDYSQYEVFHRKIQKAITTGIDLKKDKGIFVVADNHTRFAQRQSQSPAFPTPWKQLNQAFDSGGTNTGNIIVVIGKEKRFKTAFLINTARGYLRMKKRVVYFDFENGEGGLSMRMDQSMMRKSKPEISSGDYDKKLAKLYRKYKRLDCEVVIKRFPAYQTTTDNLQAWLDEQYSEYGMKFDQCIIDYAGLMGAKSGIKDDTQRISDVYIDLKNFGDYNQFDCIWTANHTTREASVKREGTKFQSTDTAKCIDIARHMDVMIGLNQNEDEKANGVMRVEMVEQRLGPMDHTCMMLIDMKSQRVDEFSDKEIKAYYEMLKDNRKGEKTNGDL